MSKQHPTVLIVGSGPTALTAATILAEHRVDVRVVSASSGPIQQSRALVVQARTLELWQKLGLADQAVHDGHRVNGAIGIQDGHVLKGGKPIVDFSVIGAGQTPFPFFLVHEQSLTEPMMLEQLQRRGGQVEWKTKVVGLRQDGEQVEVDLVQPDGSTETVEPDWVIGADEASRGLVMN